MIGNDIATAFIAACRVELQALKPGNVHVHAAGHGMTVAHFLASAEASAPHIAGAGARVGARILNAVTATRAVCGQNTNLGILLLAAPLAAATEVGGDAARGLTTVLERLTVADAVDAYAAIRLAAPGGLGRSDRHDVADEPEVTLLEAMRAAADRDRVAAQYANGFADVLGLGVPRLRKCRAAGWPEPWAITGTYLVFLASFPDTHVARKHGSPVADEVRRRAESLDAALLAAPAPDRLEAELIELDAELKRAGINPGTSADLTVASHLADALFAT